MYQDVHGKFQVFHTWSVSQSIMQKNDTFDEVRNASGRIVVFY